MNNSFLSQLTELAEASYSDFYNTTLYTQQIDALKEIKISQTQAENLLANWSIASHQPNTANGFSATLFKSKDINSQPQYVLAIRGTEPVWIKPIATDLGATGVIPGTVYLSPFSCTNCLNA